MKKTAPNADAQWKKIAALPAENGRERNRRIGSIGSRARSSQATNASASSSPSANASRTSGLSQPAGLPRTSPQTIPSAAAVTSASPAASTEVSGPKLSSIHVWASGIRSAAIGTLSQKIQGHETPSTTAPPRNGPRGTASPLTPAKRPSAFGRSWGGKAVLNRASASGITSAAPAPWRTRAAISHPTSGARAHATDATANSANPETNIRRRPKRSPSAAAVISNTAKLRT
jgi:hypothetical protein